MSQIAYWVALITPTGPRALFCVLNPSEGVKAINALQLENPGAQYTIIHTTVR